MYHRYKVDQSQRLPPAEGAELRAARFNAWLAESQGAELDTELVRHWAVVDLMAHQEASFPPTDEPSQRRVLEAMEGNAQRQPGYALTLRTLMPDLDLRDVADTSRSHSPEAGMPPPPASAPHERAAAQAIEQTNAGLLLMPVDALREDQARDMVRDDVAGLRSIHNEAERHFAAVTMGHSAQQQRTYRAELEAQDPLVAREIEAALQEDARRIAAKEERKRAESDFLLVEIERRPDPVGTAETPAVVETARSDAEAVRRISTIDERTLALVVMGWRAYEHDGYREALRNIAPDIESVAVALQSRVEDDAYKLPRDPAEDAMLDAAVRGLHVEVAPSSGVAAEHDAPGSDVMATVSTEFAATGTSEPAQQAPLPVALQDIALRRRVERARDWNLQEERNTVGTYYAAQDVESDLAALRGIADFQQRALTLQAMVTSAAHQVAYRDELLRRDPVVAAEAVRHADAALHTERAPDASPGVKRSDMTLEGYFDTLPVDTGERPIFVTWLGGFVVPSHLELGSFPDSAWHAVSALARSRGLLLADDTFGSDIRRREVRGETLNTAVAEGDARFGPPSPAPAPTATDSSSPAVATTTNSPVPPTAAHIQEVRPLEPAAPAGVDDKLAQERTHLAAIRDRHAAVNATGKTAATLTDDEAALLAQADAESLRQIRKADHLLELAAELGASLENPRYRAALEKADFQVAKAMESLHIEGQLQAEREKVRASRPRGLQGVLVEMGEAPYQFNESQEKTFYAKYLEDNGREGIVWGRHLPAALRTSEAEIGDRIWFVRKPTPPELRENSEGLLPCDLAEFAVEVREKAQLPEDTPDARAVAPGQGPTYRFRITHPAASPDSPAPTDVVLSENVAGLAAALDVRRGHRVHVEDFRLGQLWQLEVDAGGTIRSTQGSAFDIANLSDADAAPAIKQEEPAATPPGSSTQHEIDRRLRERVATLRAQDLERARQAVGLSAPQPGPQEENDSPATPGRVDADDAAKLPPAPSGHVPAGKAPDGQHAAATAAPVAPLKGAQPTPPADTTANGFTGDPADASRPTPSETISRLLESITYEMKRDGSVLYLVRDRPAFVDHGQQILMHKATNEDDEAVLAAVLLAKEKWGGKIELTGTEEFKRRALVVMLKHNVDVQLKNPQQEALRRELAQSTPRADGAQDDAGPKPLMGKPASQRATDARPDVSASKSTSPAATADAAAAAIPAAAVPTPAPPAAAPTAAELAPIHARDWWAVQRDAIHYWSRNPTERDADMKRLGPEPGEAHMFWFDKAGRRCDPPADAEAFAARVTAANANSKERNMATKQGTPQEPPQVVLRGVKKVGEKFETTALLFKGKGDFLQGFIMIGGQKRQVIVHMNERKPNSETGELRPNFLRISEAQGDAKNPQWREIGYGNAVNHRADGKPVYFDEVLFNVGNDVVKARATGSVDAALQRSLGFLEARRSRAAANDSSDRPADASLPKAAPAADVREAVAGAAAPTKSRHSSRSRAAA